MNVIQYVATMGAYVLILTAITIIPALLLTWLAVWLWRLPGELRKAHQYKKSYKGRQVYWH